MKHAASKYEVAALTWDQVKERLQAGAVAIRLFFCEGPSGEVIELFQNLAT